MRKAGRRRFCRVTTLVAATRHGDIVSLSRMRVEETRVVQKSFKLYFRLFSDTCFTTKYKSTVDVPVRSLVNGWCLILLDRRTHIAPG